MDELSARCTELGKLLEEVRGDYCLATDLGRRVGRFVALLMEEALGEEPTDLLSARHEVLRAAGFLDEPGRRQMDFIVSYLVDDPVNLLRWRPKWRRTWPERQDKLWSGLVGQAEESLGRLAAEGRAGVPATGGSDQTTDQDDGARDTAAMAEVATVRASSPTTEQLEQELSRVAATDDTILLTGETGTGKDYYARRIHSESGRKDRNLGGEEGFFQVNCAGLAEQILESELFGHVKGAYSGADRAKEGLVAAAKNGTVFLNEVGELSYGMQGKLLRLIEDRRYHVVGSEEIDRSCGCRFILATNVDVHAAMEAGTFREDLYHRMKRHYHLPPLRDRKHEIPKLLRVFLEQWEKGRGKSALTPSERKARRTDGARRIPVAVRNALRDSDYDWPGNVRQLRNAVFQVLDDSKPKSRDAVTAAAILTAAKRGPVQ